MHTCYGAPTAFNIWWSLVCKIYRSKSRSENHSKFCYPKIATPIFGVKKCRDLAHIHPHVRARCRERLQPLGCGIALDMHAEWVWTSPVSAYSLPAFGSTPKLQVWRLVRNIVEISSKQCGPQGAIQKRMRMFFYSHDIVIYITVANFIAKIATKFATFRYDS